MLELGEEMNLPDKPQLHSFAGCIADAEDLDRDTSVVSEISCQVHDTMRALADPAEHLVSIAEGLSE
jgi:hypothetical protein